MKQDGDAAMLKALKEISENTRFLTHEAVEVKEGPLLRIEALLTKIAAKLCGPDS